MPVYVIAQGRIENRKMLDEYVGKAIPTIEAHGARVVAYDETPEVIEGSVDTSPPRKPSGSGTTRPSTRPSCRFGSTPRRAP